MKVSVQINYAPTCLALTFGKDTTRPCDHENVQGIVRRQQQNLGDNYIINWLQQFEMALDDSTLINQYQ